MPPWTRRSRLRARLSRQALRDLREAAAYIALDDPGVAAEFRDTVDELADRLGRFPALGGFRPRLTGKPLRFFALQRFRYLVVYDGRIVPPVILRILHTSRDIGPLLAELG